MSTRPKVTRLVMYKHGVAYLERRGPADGEFELTFRRDDMNDVLKSLAVAVLGGDATVGAVAYESPTDPDDVLANRNLLLSSGEALPGLLHAVRGRAIEVTANGQVHHGEVIGIDEVDGGTAGSRRLLVLRTGPGAIQLVDLAETSALELIEDPSRADLEFLVDRSRAATVGDNRIVRVQVNGSTDDLRISYIVPAPIWRVSYRLVREGDSVTLLAMGIVHNPVDEELDDVELTLTTGQPVSFDIDLYHGRRVQRAVVEETERAGYAPTSYETSYAAGDAHPASYPMPAAPRGAAPSAFLESAEAPSSMDRSLGAVVTSYGTDPTDTGERGEHFEYRVTTPISLKRGGASMVPLLVARLDDARKERIWREGASSAPDIVLGFDNTTGVVLEEGPAVVYDDGSYAGEAMVPYATRGSDIRLAFAKDLGVHCNRTSSATTVSTRVRLGDDALIEELRRDETHVLRAENDGEEPVDVIFELRRHHDASLRTGDDLIQPFEQTASYHRFRIAVPAHGVAEASVGESRPLFQSIRYVQLTPDSLHRWLEDRLLDESTFAELSTVLGHWEQASRLDGHGGRLEAERTDVYAGLTRITEQLNVLRDSGPEAAVRQRSVDQLVALQDRATALDVEIRRTRDAADVERQAASAELAQVIARGGRG